MDRILRIEGTARISAPADITVVKAFISGVKPTFEEAVRSLADCTRQVKDAVEKAGVPRDDVRSSRLSIQQNFREEKIGEDRHGNDKFRNVPDGFSYSQDVSFEFPTDSDKLSESVMNIMACDVQPRITFSFRSSELDSVNEKALKEAVINARREAETIAEAAGCRLGALVNVERRGPMVANRCYEDAIDFPKSKAMGAPLSFDFNPEDVDVERSVYMEWEIADRLPRRRRGRSRRDP